MGLIIMGGEDVIWGDEVGEECEMGRDVALGLHLGGQR